MARPYKFRLGEVDAFRDRSFIPMDNATITFTGSHSLHDDYAMDSYGARFYERLENGCIMYLSKPGAVLVQDFIEGEVSKLFILTNNFGEDVGLDVYYRLVSDADTTWKLTKRLNLLNFSSGQIEVFSGDYNTYEFKFVVTSGAINIYGFYEYKYINSSGNIIDGNLAFEFEINPSSWKHSFDGGSLYISANGTVHARGQSFSSGASNSARGKIDFHFDFIRGISKTDADTYRQIPLSTPRLLSTLDHSDKYKLEYLARRGNKLLLLGDEYMDLDETWTFGRIWYICRIQPGSLRFVRNLNKIGRTVNGTNTEYQQSYSSDLSLIDILPIV